MIHHSAITVINISLDCSQFQPPWVFGGKTNSTPLLCQFQLDNGCGRFILSLLFCFVLSTNHWLVLKISIILRFTTNQIALSVKCFIFYKVNVMKSYVKGANMRIKAIVEVPTSFPVSVFFPSPGPIETVRTTKKHPKLFKKLLTNACSRPYWQNIGTRSLGL